MSAPTVQKGRLTISTNTTPDDESGQRPGRLFSHPLTQQARDKVSPASDQPAYENLFREPRHRDTKD